MSMTAATVLGASMVEVHDEGVDTALSRYWRSCCTRVVLSGFEMGRLQQHIYRRDPGCRRKIILRGDASAKCHEHKESGTISRAWGRLGLYSVLLSLPTGPYWGSG